uniref:Uncharacterized protein n=1 Tax=Knipowitschia caucasica TaxID=637954 RepID=A0AAV2MC78_KNICA
MVIPPHQNPLLCIDLRSHFCSRWDDGCGPNSRLQPPVCISKRRRGHLFSNEGYTDMAAVVGMWETFSTVLSHA